MRRGLILSAALAAAVATLAGEIPASAQNYQRAWGYCVQQALSAPGSPQDVSANCTVNVYNTGTTTPASTIYSDNQGTPLTPPFSADSNGLWAFYYNAAGAQNYDVRLSAGNPALTPYTIPSVAVLAGAGTVTSFSSGNLSPLFTTSVANATTTPALSFTLSSANADKVFANCTASSAAPSFCSITSAMLPTIGSDTQVIFNDAGTLTGSSGLTWDDGVDGQLNVTGGQPGYCIESCATGDVLLDVNGLALNSESGQDMYFGPRGNGAGDTAVFTIAGGSGATTLPLGYFRFGGGGAPAKLFVNDGTVGSGMYEGPTISTAAPSANYNFILPSAAGTSGYYLTSAGGGTSPMTWTAPATLYNCGATSTCANTLGAPYILREGTAALVSGTPSTVVISGFNPTYTSTSTFACTANDTAAVQALKVALTSSSSITITGGSSSTDVVAWQCAGY